MKIELLKPSGELIADLGEWTPTYLGSTILGQRHCEIGNGVVIRDNGLVRFEATIAFSADMSAYNRALDKARLNCLRYPPKQPARGSISRRREKVRKAGLLR